MRDLERIEDSMREAFLAFVKSSSGEGPDHVRRKAHKKLRAHESEVSRLIGASWRVELYRDVEV